MKSSIITDEKENMIPKNRKPISIQRVNTLINGKRGVTAETAILLSGYLKTTPEFWMNLQASCDLYEAQLEFASA